MAGGVEAGAWGLMRDQVFPWVWVFWLALIAISFGLIEGAALKSGRTTLSRTVWVISKNWPPFPWVVGVIVGFLAAHFFWIGQGTDLVK
jgi:hypothetical protein